MSDWPRNQFATCEHGIPILVVNCKVTCACEHSVCAEYGGYGFSEPLLQANGDRDGMVCAELGWCQCASPADVDHAMLSYLEGSGRGVPQAMGSAARERDLLLAYIAADLGWTEHGGSVWGSWLTDAGREALANLRAWVSGE